MALYMNGAASTIVAINVTAGKNDNKIKKTYRSRRRLVRDGQCAAALRAFLAARAYADGWFDSLAAAAVSAGSNVHYTRAALTLRKSNDERLMWQVRYGNVPILTAAAQVEPQVKLIETYRKASPANLEAFRVATGATADLTKHIRHSSTDQLITTTRNLGGPEVVWNTMVEPALTAPAE